MAPDATNCSTSRLQSAAAVNTGLYTPCKPRMPQRMLDKKLFNTYRTLQLDFAGRHDAPASRKEQGRWPYLDYKPCVSFDTVPLASSSGSSRGIENANGSASANGSADSEYPSYEFPGVQLPPDLELFTMDEWYDNESGYASADNAGYFGHNDYVTSKTKSKGKTRSASPPPSFGSSSAAALRQLRSMLKVARNGKLVREDYPSRPSITGDAMIITRAYGNWDRNWSALKRQVDSRLKDKDSYFQYPQVLFPESSRKKKNSSGQSSASIAAPSSDGYTPLTKSEKRKLEVMARVVANPNVPRTIICHISGRKHTWVALDYTVTKLASNTDHVVVVANLPRLKRHRTVAPLRSSGNHRPPMCQHNSVPSSIISTTTTDSRRSNNKLTKIRSLDSTLLEEEKTAGDNDNDSDSETSRVWLDDEWTCGYDRSTIEDTLDNILLYIGVLLSKNPRAIKITVEMVIGKSDEIVNEMTNVYIPDYIVMSKKKITSEIRWKSAHLADNLIKTAPIPVCVVFAKPMYQFELDLQKQFREEASLDAVPPEKKLSLAQMDELINTSIRASAKVERPKGPKKLKSMIEIAMEDDLKKGKQASRSSTRHSSRSNSKARASTQSPRPIKTAMASMGTPSLMKSVERIPEVLPGVIPEVISEVGPNGLRRPRIMVSHSYNVGTTNKTNDNLHHHRDHDGPDGIGVALTPSKSISTTAPVHHREMKHHHSDPLAMRKVKSIDAMNLKNNSNNENSEGGGFFSSFFRSSNDNNSSSRKKSGLFW